MVFQPIRAYNRDAGHIKWVALSTICNVCLCVGLHTALSLSASTGPLCVTSCMGSQCFSLLVWEGQHSRGAGTSATMVSMTTTCATTGPTAVSTIRGMRPLAPTSLLAYWVSKVSQHRSWYCTAQIFCGL